ncbi:MAG: Laminin G, sub domain 2, partial [Candidatus Gottesmanbacteria bacterium GW2011_GWC2_39_8]
EENRREIATNEFGHWTTRSSSWASATGPCHPTRKTRNRTRRASAESLGGKKMKRTILALIILTFLVVACDGGLQGATPTAVPPTAVPTLVPPTPTYQPATAVPPTAVTAVPPPTAVPPTATPAGPVKDRHGCSLFADNFMDQVEYTVDQPSGRVAGPAGTTAGFVWGPNLTIDGRTFGRKGVWLTNAGAINVSGAYRIRWHKVTIFSDYKVWSKCFVEGDEAVSYDWVEYTPGVAVAPTATLRAAVSPSATPGRQIFGLDRHGCPDQADHFMNQVEFTIDQPNGKITSPDRTNVGFIWGWDLVINGKHYGRVLVWITGPGTYTVSGAYRIRWHVLNKSTVAEYQAWSTCFVFKDENTTYPTDSFKP